MATENLFNAEGLVAVVTGGGTGIGFMIAKALADNGAAKVYILGRRQQVLEEAVSKIGKGAVVVPVVCDVSSKDSLLAASKVVTEQSGYINLLVCNSGVGGPQSKRVNPEMTIDEFVDIHLALDAAQYAQTFAVNTVAVWYTSMAFLKLLDAGNKKANVPQTSNIIAISSIAGFNKINTGGFAYGQSKAACTHLVKQLSVVLPQWDIRVNAICPGLYPSEMSAPIIQNAGGISRQQVPLGRAGDEQDMSGTVLYLASRAGAYCNGAIIVTDGGRLTTFPSTF